MKALADNELRPCTAPEGFGDLCVAPPRPIDIDLQQHVGRLDPLLGRGFIFAYQLGEFSTFLRR
jgi:hypothetical protein